MSVLDKIMEDTSISTPEEGKTTGQAQNPLLIPGAIIIAGALIAGAVVYSNSPRTSVPLGKAATVSVSPPAGSVVAGDLSDDDPFLGNPNAPVTVVEFGDFQCPFCARLFRDTLSQLKEKYVNTGKVKFVYRDFPLTSIHVSAQKAAEAAECADEQGEFWAYHDLLYSRQDQIKDEKLGVWAKELGLDMGRFDACISGGRYAEEVKKDFAAGQAAGVTGTPATFVNGRLIQGAVPYAQFEAIIEEELKKAATR